jgi:23S rRNA (uracil1939-C5)-methyltransferase
MNPGDEFTAKIEDIAYYEGAGVAKIDGFVIFIPWTVPGDVVRAKLIKSKGAYGIGNLIEIVKKSNFRVNPSCPLFYSCGGCTLQNLKYEKQLEIKENFIRQSLRRIGHTDLSKILFQPIISSPEIWFYRNKMEFCFGKSDGKINIGLHKRGSYRDMVNVEKCNIFSQRAEGIVQFFRDFAENKKLEVYDNVTHQGFLRWLVIREGKNTGEVMVNLVTNYGEIPDIDELKREALSNFPEIKSLLWTVNTQRADAVLTERERVLGGMPFITEMIGAIKFRIGSQTFFQPNSYATEKLYSRLVGLANLTGRETILDLYSGSGGIGLSLSKKSKMVFGIESSPDSVSAGEENIRINRVGNMSLILGDVRKVIYKRRGWKGNIDLVVMDPPRAGIAKKTMRWIVGLRSPRIIYVSCNPATLARDISIFVQNGYSLREVQGIDMFPHTYHVEVIAYLEKVPLA